MKCSLSSLIFIKHLIPERYEEEEDEDEEIFDQVSADDDAVASDSSANIAAAGDQAIPAENRRRKKSVRFDADDPDPVMAAEPTGSLDGNSSSQAGNRSSRPPAGNLTSWGGSVEGVVSVTSVYRLYVDQMLRKIGMKKLRVRLKELLDGTLQRVKHALQREPAVYGGMPEVSSTTGCWEC